MTGGPNNWAARVNYPPTGPEGSYVFFNYKDTVDVEWTSWAENSTVTTMQIYWWAPTLGSGQWQPLQQDVVAQNGSKTYSLNGVKNQGAGYYLGQWNLNFTRADNSPATGLTLSQAFNCSFDDSIQPRAFAQGLAPPTTPPAPQSSSTQAATSTSSSTQVVTNSPSTTPNDSSAAAASTTAATGYVNSTSLSGGAIAGVIIAVIAALGLGAAGAFLLWRRAQHKKSMETAGAAAGGGFPPHQPPPQYAQYPGQYQGYNPGYNQGFNQGLHPPGPMGYGGDYKQPLPQGSGHGEFYKPQVMMAEAPGHSFSELPAQSHRREFSRQELPG